MCLMKHFPQERKEAAACGMQRLITNSEPLFNFRLLSFFFLVAALSSVMACFVVFCALEGSLRKWSRELIRDISQPLTSQDLCVIFADQALVHGEAFFILLLILVLPGAYKDPSSCMHPFTSVDCCSAIQSGSFHTGVHSPIANQLIVFL